MAAKNQPALPVTPQLKEKFKQFCNVEFYGKGTSLNLNNNKEKWFFVHTSSYYSWHIHYEYLDGSVQLHSEFTDINLENSFENYIDTKIQGNSQFTSAKKFGNIKPWIYSKPINTEQDLWNAFIAVRDFFDPIIKTFEQRNMFSLPVNIFFTKDNNDKETLKYFLCHINKDDTLFSCLQTEIAKNAFKNDKTLNVFYKNITDGIGEIKINESAFENCENLSTIIFANANLENSENLDINDVVSADSTTAAKITIQYHAFKDCENLHTVVLPKFNSLIIEKEAFENCKNLRSIVLVENVVSTGSTTERVSISEEAFSNCSDLNFICIKDGKIARYARENNFKVVAIDE